MKSDTIKKRHRYESDRLKKKGKRKAKKRQKVQQENAQAAAAAAIATMAVTAAVTPVQPQVATPDLCDGSCISGPGAFNF